jgi:hypothetical protein
MNEPKSKGNRTIPNYVTRIHKPNFPALSRI